jgi:hypothetical protein
VTASRPIRVVPLALHPDLVPELVEAFATQWPAWARRTTREEVARGFDSAAPGSLPQVFVALDGERVAGTIALRPWFDEVPMNETPWVRGLLVLLPYRGGPAYRLLAAAAEDAARSLGYRTLYAATTSIEPLIARRGWEVFRRFEREGEAFTWLRKTL